MRSNFGNINISCSITNEFNKISTATISLLTNGSVSNARLAEILNEKTSFVQDGIDYEFSVQIVMKPLTIAQQNAAPIIVQSQIIEISFALNDAEEIVPFLCRALHGARMGLSLVETHDLRRMLLIGEEKTYLKRAIKQIDNLRKKEDDPSLKEFTELMLHVFELPILSQINILRKLGKYLQDNDYKKCARSLTILYKDYMDNPIEKNYAGRIELHNDGDNRELLLVLPAGDYRNNLLSSLANNFTTSINKTRLEPIEEGILISSNKSAIPLLIEKIFIILRANKYLLSSSAQCSIRYNLVGDDVISYLNCAEVLLDKLYEVGDEPESLEYCHLLTLIFDIYVNNRSEFTCELVKKLISKNFNKCAVGLTNMYGKDPLCPELAVLHAKLNAPKVDKAIINMMPIVSSHAETGNKIEVAASCNGTRHRRVISSPF